MRTDASALRSQRRGPARTNSGRRWDEWRARTETGISCARACQQTPTRRSSRATEMLLRMPGLLSQMRRVGVGVEQRVFLLGVLEAELDHPPVAVRSGVFERGLLVEPVVHGDDFARERRVQLG